FPLLYRVRHFCATFISQCYATKHLQFMRYFPTLLRAQARTGLSSHRPSL
ncbi:hypothetical protein QBC45DRAFT_317371, partial [Copromyces sp. CBS 386.78]